MKYELEERISLLNKENNQLKVDLSRSNLEYEKLEMRFSQQVDEYEVEIDGLTNKLKDKENTIKVNIKCFTQKIK